MKHAAITKRLHEQRTEILGRRGDRPVIEHYPDAMDRSNANQALHRIADDRERDTKTLKDIAAALAAIEAGDYGICPCGKEIPEKRLIAHPWALHCIKCAERAEAKGKYEEHYGLD